MRALLFDGQLRLVCDYPLPAVPPGEVRIRVLRAGICNTDLEIIKGYMGFRGVLGHEFVGLAEEGPWQGRRVVGEINASCESCPACRRGDRSHCPKRTTLGIDRRDGSLAEHVVLPQHCLHVVPEGVTDREAVFTEPLAAALEITERLHIRPTDHVAVLGDGKLGLLCAQVLRLTGCRLLLIGHHASKMELLRKQGVEVTVRGEEIRESFDVVVDCTGHADGFDLARRLTRPRGTLVLKSTFHGGQAGSFVPLVVDEVTLVGSRCGPFAPALRLLEQKLVEVDALTDSEFPVDRALEAFARAAAPGARKVQVVF